MTVGQGLKVPSESSLFPVSFVFFFKDSREFSSSTNDNTTEMAVTDRSSDRKDTVAVVAVPAIIQTRIFRIAKSFGSTVLIKRFYIGHQDHQRQKVSDKKYSLQFFLFIW